VLRSVLAASARATALVLAALLAAGCPSNPEPDPRSLIPTPTPVPAIRIGMVEDAPPFSFRQGDRPAGIDVDLATYLGQDLGRPLRVFTMSYDELVPALLDKRVDIIMSGLSISRLRELQVDFGDPILRSGVGVLVRRSEASRWKSPSQAVKEAQRIGVTKNTAAERYVREHAPDSQVFGYVSNTNAIAELEQRRVDAFVADAPIIAWYAASHEGSMMPMLRPLLTQDQIAWGFRPSSRRLRERANESIARWRTDGTLNGVLRRWVPAWEPH